MQVPHPHRILRWLAPVALAASIVIPITPGHAGHASDSTITITLWDHDTFSGLTGPLDKMMLVYEKTHPNIQLKLVHNQTLDKTLTAMASGNGPDIVWLWDGSAPVPDWANAGLIQPVDKYIASSHYNIKNLVPAAVQQISWHGHTWGLPLVADTFWLWYNVQDFKAAGLDPNKPPTTLQQVMADAIKLTKRTSSGRILRLGYLPPFLNAGSGTSNGAAEAYVNGNDVNPYAGVFGSSLYSADSSKVTPDSPANLAVWNEERSEMATYDRLYGHSNVIRFVASLGAPFTAQEGFLTDQVSMKIDGDWVPQNVRDNKPGWKYGVNYAVAPIPYAQGYAKFADHQPIATYPLVISSKSPHPDQAWQFISWLQEPANVSGMAAFLYNLPEYTAALSSPQLTSLPGFNALLPLLQRRVTLVTDPIAPGTPQYYNILNSYTDAILSGQTTPAAAMASVKQRAQALLDKLLAASH
jgi:multiple sugar transport system substrate-binding protein